MRAGGLRTALVVGAALLLLAPLVGCGRASTGTGGAGNGAVAPPRGSAPASGADRNAIGTRELTFTDAARGRTLVTTVWYPAVRSGGEGATPAHGPFPVVLFSHGLTGLPTDYRSLLNAWAGAGFVVVAPTYPNTNRRARDVKAADVVNQPADASFVLTSVLGLAQKPGDPFAGLLDGRHVAAAGHSLGGITTVGLFSACCHDARLAAGVVLAGNSFGFGDTPALPAAPLLFEHGASDHVVPHATGHHTYDVRPGPKAFVTFDGQGHFDPYLKASSPSFAVDVATTTDFFRWTLQGNTDALAALWRDGAAPGVARVEDRLSGP